MRRDIYFVLHCSSYLAEGAVEWRSRILCGLYNKIWCANVKWPEYSKAHIFRSWATVLNYVKAHSVCYCFDKYVRKFMSFTKCQSVNAPLHLSLLVWPQPFPKVVWVSLVLYSNQRMLPHLSHMRPFSNLVLRVSITSDPSMYLCLTSHTYVHQRSADNTTIAPSIEVFASKFLSHNLRQAFSHSFIQKISFKVQVLILSNEMNQIVSQFFRSLVVSIFVNFLLPIAISLYNSMYPWNFVIQFLMLQFVYAPRIVWALHGWPHLNIVRQFSPLL